MTSPGPDDATLVERARGGDGEALAALLSRHRSLLLALATGALGDAGLAEEAVQEAALQAMLGLDRLRDPGRFGAWLAGICLNLCRRTRRQRVRDAWSWEAMLGGRRVAEPTDEAPGPDELAEAAEEREWLLVAIASLPAGQQAAVTLHYLAGLTQVEAAAVLRIEVGAVKARLHKARWSLRRRLLAAGWDVPDRTGGRPMIEMRVVDVLRTATPDALPGHAKYVVLLADPTGDRRLPVWIGEAEARALALHLAGTPLPRPLTYAFAASVMDAAGGRLREIRIDRLDGDVYYASAVVVGATGERTVDARPSDALNLALLVGAPIRVEPAILATIEIADEARRLFDGTGDGAAAIAADVVAEWQAGEPPRPASERSEEGDTAV